MATKKKGVRAVASLLALALALAGIAACGEDPPPAPAAKPAAKATAPAAKSGGKKGGKGATTVQVYTKVEDIVTDPDERKAIRRPFVENDFAADSSGTQNRDPFRSYVIRQVGTGVVGQQQQREEGDDNCSEAQMKASRYPLRALSLIGVVLRGAKSYGLFRDTSGYGWIVKRNDCLGKEKARVTKIDAEFIALEIMPEVGLNQAPKPAVEQMIKLHQKDLDLAVEEEIVPGSDNPIPPGGSAPAMPDGSGTPPPVTTGPGSE